MLSLGISIISIDVFSTYRDFNISAKKMRTDYIEQQMQIIKREAERFVDLIDVNRRKIITNERKKLKSRAYVACSIAQNIYQQNKDIKSDTEIKKVIIDALRTIRFDQNQGYYFIYSSDGTKILCKNDPELEGKNFFDSQDVAGNYYVKDMIKISEESEQGFYEFFRNKPDKNGDRYRRVVYVRMFKPYNWIIGTGFYMDDAEKLVKANFLERVNSTHYGRNGYFFAINWKGVVLAHSTQPTHINRNMWDLADSKGTKFVQKLIAVSKYKHGGCVKYWWHKPESEDERQKITFAVGLPEWGCCLATGVYLDDIEPIILAKQAILNQQIKKKLLLFIAFITVTILLFLWFFNRVSARLDKDFSQFIAFFKRAVHSNEPVDHRAIKFSEFDELAISANEMLQDKIFARQALDNEKEQLAVTLHSIGDGVITTDTAGRIELMNTVAEDITGWRMAEAAGKMLPEVFCIIHEETREIVINPVDRVLAKGHIVELASDSILISKDGKEYYISDSAAPIRGADSSIRGVVLVFRDVTTQRKAESALLNAKKLESIGVLAGGIAHDFNNVLTGLFGNIELAKCELLKEHSSYQYIEMAEQALSRAKNLTKQLLTFAKGGVPILAAVELQDVVTESVKFNLSGSNVKAQFNLPDDLWQVKADKGQLNQVVANLTINADQAMPQGGTLCIDAENVKNISDSAHPELSGDFVKLTISDNGCGIAAKDLDKIFDPYFSTKQSGNGLGLATVQSIIAKHNGDISVVSTVGVGTTFTVLLPAEKSSEKLNKATKIEVIRKTESPLGHILVMDDEEIIIKISKAMLKACGYTCESARDGVEALEKYIAADKAGTPFDIVIMDLTIPGGMGGKDAINKFLEVNSDVKVIVSSGYSVDPVLANYTDYGFKGRLVKPFRINDLARELADVIQM